MRHILYIMCSALAFTACTSNLKKENEALRDEIDERREQLETNLQENLEIARKELAATDSLLSHSRSEYESQHEWVMSHAIKLSDDSPEVLRLNRLRAQCDSLQVEFEKQAQKVKFFISKVEK